MEEMQLLRQLKQQNPAALEQAIRQYGAYVAAIIRGRGHAPEDVEELSADVFFALWENAAKIETGNLRAWLGTVARNKAVERFRRFRQPLTLEEDILRVEDDLWQQLSAKERAAMVQEALNTLCPQDREIFFRYYDLGQNARQIAAIMQMPHSTVRTRLSRGRQTLKTYFEKGGMLDVSAI